jgi:hypothetical protein
MENKNLVIGQTVSSDLYGYGRGVIFYIHGIASPVSASHFLNDTKLSCGRVEFDIVFYCGKICRRLPENILRDVQWNIGDDVCSQAEVDRLVTDALQEERRKEQEIKEIKSAFDSEVDRLKNSPEFSHLKMIEKNKNSTVAAVVSANIRLLLKQSFPGVKFSVKKTNYDAVTVKWEDGPQNEKVEEITRKFKNGCFNSMEDIYEYSESPFNTVYGGVHYVSVDRRYSDKLIEKSITQCRKLFSEDVPEWVDVDSYKRGKLFTISSGFFCHDNLQSEIRFVLRSL